MIDKNDDFQQDENWNSVQWEPGEFVVTAPGAFKTKTYACKKCGRECQTAMVIQMWEESAPEYDDFVAEFGSAEIAVCMICYGRHLLA